MEPLALSTVLLRKMIGVLGIALPVLCLVYWLFSGLPLLNSISAHYFTQVHGAFVGILFGLGVCLASYKGHHRIDMKIAMFGGVCAFCVALFPTDVSGEPKPVADLALDMGRLLVVPAEWSFYVHNVSASLLFVVFFIFSAALFTRTEGGAPSAIEVCRSAAQNLVLPKAMLAGKPVTPRKRQRNGVYVACAWAIGLSIVMALVSSRFGWSIFWWEAVAIFAFAISWITKAEWLLPDQGSWFFGLSGGEMQPAPATD